MNCRLGKGVVPTKRIRVCQDVSVTFKKVGERTIKAL